MEKWRAARHCERGLSGGKNSLPGTASSDPVGEILHSVTIKDNDGPRRPRGLKEKWSDGGGGGSIYSEGREKRREGNIRCSGIKTKKRTTQSKGKGKGN